LESGVANYFMMSSAEKGLDFSNGGGTSL